MQGYEKWENYTAGKVKFINKHRDNPFREFFVRTVIGDKLSSVIEIGAGECIEALEIYRQNPSIDYTVVDVSKFFLDQAPAFANRIESTVEDMKRGTVLSGRRDIVYASSVIEHTKDPERAIDNMMKAANRFFFVMFKWRWEGGLKPNYHKARKYWTSEFNIWKILKLIEARGAIEICDVFVQNDEEAAAGGVVQRRLEKYSEGMSGLHRTGNHLVISGTSNI